MVDLDEDRGGLVGRLGPEDFSNPRLFQCKTCGSHCTAYTHDPNSEIYGICIYMGLVKKGQSCNYRESDA